MDPCQNKNYSYKEKHWPNQFSTRKKRVKRQNVQFQCSTFLKFRWVSVVLVDLHKIWMKRNMKLKKNFFSVLFVHIFRFVFRSTNYLWHNFSVSFVNEHSFSLEILSLCPLVKVLLRFGFEVIRQSNTNDGLTILFRGKKIFTINKMQPWHCLAINWSLRSCSRIIINLIHRTYDNGIGIRQWYAHFHSCFFFFIHKWPDVVENFD